MRLEPGAPCPWCAVRPDVPCRHRPADPDYRRPEQDEGEEDKYKPKRGEGQGLNFKTRKVRVAGGGNYRRKRRD